MNKAEFKTLEQSWLLFKLVTIYRGHGVPKGLPTLRLKATGHKAQV